MRVKVTDGRFIDVATYRPNALDPVFDRKYMTDVLFCLWLFSEVSLQQMPCSSIFFFVSLSVLVEVYFMR